MFLAYKISKFSCDRFAILPPPLVIKIYEARMHFTKQPKFFFFNISLKLRYLKAKMASPHPHKLGVWLHQLIKLTRIITFHFLFLQVSKVLILLWNQWPGTILVLSGHNSDDKENSSKARNIKQILNIF